MTKTPADPEATVATTLRQSEFNGLKHRADALGLTTAAMLRILLREFLAGRIGLVVGSCGQEQATIQTRR